MRHAVSCVRVIGDKTPHDFECCCLTNDNTPIDMGQSWDSDKPCLFVIAQVHRAVSEGGNTRMEEYQETHTVTTRAEAARALCAKIYEDASDMASFFE